MGSESNETSVASIADQEGQEGFPRDLLVTCKRLVRDLREKIISSIMSASFRCSDNFL